MSGPAPASSDPGERLSLADALAITSDADADAAEAAGSADIAGPEGTTLIGHVHEGFDVFGIPHGGYLAALAANAVLTATAQPDVLSLTTHFLRKAQVGPMTFTVTTVGGSRRFTTVTATGVQDGAVVLAIMASVGDRDVFTGPTWQADAPTRVDDAALGAPAGDPSLPFSPPAVAERMRMRMDTTTIGFAMGRTGPEARIRGVAEAEPVDQLTAIVVSDLTPPAVWNALGATGWVPTVELTAHVRARPAPGPLTVDAVTRHVTDGFLEEDAVVTDADGQLVVQSRQLARWTELTG